MNLTASNMKIRLQTTQFSDFFAALEKFDLILYFAWSDIKARYARSILGPLWLVLTTAIGVAGLGYIWSILFNMDRATFIPALAIGLVIWQLLSTSLLEASVTFIVNAQVIKNSNNPILIFVFHTLMKNLIIFAHNFIIIFIILIIYPPDINLKTLLIIPGLFLVIGNLVWMISILAIVGVRYRDLQPALSSFMTIFFFLSPVIYKPDQLGVKANLMWLNPFTYLISFIRDPLTGTASPLFAYAIGILALILGWIATSILLKRYKHRLVFWV